MVAARGNSVREICEGALQKVGTFSKVDEGADPAELEICYDWLGRLIAHLSGTIRVQSQVVHRIPVPLTADTQSYDLLTALGENAPVDGVEFMVGATVADDSGNEVPVDIIRRMSYEEIGDKDQSGKPCEIYVDRKDASPKLWVFPVPDTADYTLYLTYQPVMPDVEGNPEKQKPAFRASWDLFMAHRLAYEIGSGPVIRLPDFQLRQIKGYADELKADLEEYDNQEHAREPRRTAYSEQF